MAVGRHATTTIGCHMHMRLIRVSDRENSRRAEDLSQSCEAALVQLYSCTAVGSYWSYHTVGSTRIPVQLGPHCFVTWSSNKDRCTGTGTAVLLLYLCYRYRYRYYYCTCVTGIWLHLSTRTYATGIDPVSTQLYWYCTGKMGANTKATPVWKISC